MSERPFFSVIVPAHNSARFIRTGLMSIKDQEFHDYELIVVCDSCTDDTETIVKRYADKTIRSDLHSGGGARNIGLDAARGTWILFMDDDDWFMPGAFRKIAEAVSDDIDVLAYWFEWEMRGIAEQSPKRIYPAVWNKAWRKDFIGETRFPVMQHTEDLAFAWELHPRARFGFLPEVLYHYEFMRPGSVSDRIRNGEYDNSLIMEPYRKAAEGYERWLKEKY